MPSRKGVYYVLGQGALFLLFLLDFKLLSFETSDFSRGFFFGLGAVNVVLILYALIQLNTRLSPFPAPRDDSKLIIGGAFKFTRHPIYTGLFFSALCYGIVMGSGYKIIVSVVLYILFFFKSSYEEQLMLRKFPHYRSYQMEVGQLIPFIGLKS